MRHFNAIWIVCMSIQQRLITLRRERDLTQQRMVDGMIIKYQSRKWDTTRRAAKG